MTSSINTREIILDMLLDINKNSTPSHILLRDTLKKYQYLDKIERSFISKVFEGTIENQIRLDYIINSFSNTKVNRMKPLIRCVIRMSVYQIVYLDKTPDSAVCNEAVTLAAKRGFKTLKGFVNAVLRNISRNKDNIQYPDINENKKEYFSIYYSTTMWLVEQLVEQYGETVAEKILMGMNSPKNGISVRISERADKDKVIEDLNRNDIQTEESLIYERGLIIRGFDYLDKIDAFVKGDIIPQDVSSMLVAHIANPKGNEYCIDICAAPGGKAVHLAEKLKGKGYVDARDRVVSKTDLIDENIQRMKLENIGSSVSDATILDVDSIEKADIVIADLPCSGLGVISKKSDIKYNMNSETENQLVILQRNILKNAVKYLKNGGILLYSTCTINKAENVENMEWLKSEFALSPMDISEFLPKAFHEEETKSGYIQLLPGIDGTDGFFICKLKKQV